MDRIFKLAFWACFSLLSIVIHCGGQEDYQWACLGQHIGLRFRHGSAGMILDDTLNAQAVQCARDYSQRRVIDSRCARDLQKGENQIMITGETAPSNIESMNMGISLWYSKKEGYNYAEPPNSVGGLPPHLSFTQMIWNATIRLGCGVFTTGDRTVFVSLYDPPGNIVHRVNDQDSFEFFIQNVRPPFQ